MTAPPPHDLDAERVVVAAVLEQPDRLDAINGLTHRDFFDPQNGLVFTAVQQLVAETGSADPPRVRAWLEDHDLLGRAGGARHIAELITDERWVTDLAPLAERVRSRSEARHIITACQTVDSELRSGKATDPTIARERLAELLGDAGAAIGVRAGPRLRWQSATEMHGPLPELSWVVKALGIGPGRPVMVTAYAGTAKTVAMQSLGIACAAGLKVWGRFTPATDCVVRHFDYEQGQYATRRRYQRLAYGLGLDLRDLQDQLQAVSFPPLYLTDDESTWERELDGCQLAIIDSLRAAAVGVDENASEVRSCVDLLTRVSERTGTTVVLIHHAGKTKDGHSDRRQVARGSSALLDAVGCSYLLSMTHITEPRRIEQVKLPAETDGSATPPGFLEIEDVEGPSGERHGLRINWQDDTQHSLAPSTPEETLRQAETRIVLVLRSQRQPLSTRRLRALVSGSRTVFEAALEGVLDRNEVETTTNPRAGRGGGTFYRLTD